MATGKRSVDVRRVRGFLPRTLAVAGLVVLTGACADSEGQRRAVGRLAGSGSTSPDATPSPPSASAGDPATTQPGGGTAAGLEPGSPPAPALLTLPRVGANPTPVPSIVLATSTGDTTGAPQPPPNTVSLEDLYRQGQVDISR